jgi:hypothetical protein
MYASVTSAESMHQGQGMVPNGDLFQLTGTILPS